MVSAMPVGLAEFRSDVVWIRCVLTSAAMSECMLMSVFAAVSGMSEPLCPT
jgi:hypothetical protein